MPFSKLKPIGVLLLTLASATLNHASDRLYTADETANQLKALKETLMAFRAGDVSIIAKHIQFPLERPYPLPSVETPEALAQRYTDIFDDSLLRTITASVAEKDWNLVGWRGYMLQNGLVWAEIDGRIIRINHESSREHELRLKLIEADRSRIHPGLRGFKEPVLKWDTRSFKLRIDDLGDSYRLALWRSDQDVRTQPAISVDEGQRISEGSGGDHYYIFRIKGVIYRCGVNVIGDAPTDFGEFSILRNAKTLLTEAVTRTY